MESGDSYSDILIEIQENIGVVIEIKYAQDGNLERACNVTLKQVREKYDAVLYDDGMEKIIKYGIAFYKNNAR